MVLVDSAALAVWARHAPATTWCSIKHVDDSAVATYCSGAWNVSDNVDVHDNPPATERCGACVRVLAAERVQRGLAELAANAPIKPLFDAEMPDDLFDHGGEG